MNGHTIDRGLTELTDGGSVFGVADGGELTVRDGKVKGGARKALAYAVKNVTVTKRNTLLQERLSEKG